MSSADSDATQKELKEEIIVDTLSERRWWDATQKELKGVGSAEHTLYPLSRCNSERIESPRAPEVFNGGELGCNSERIESISANAPLNSSITLMQLRKN